MTVGTTYSLAKRAIIDLLRARPALAEVAVSYDAPAQPEQVVGPTGKNESVYFCDEPTEDGSQEVVLICQPFHFDEEYSLPLLIQVFRPESVDGEESPQEIADLRVDEILGEVMTAIANKPTLVEPWPAGVERLECSTASFARRTGFIGSGPGRASGCLIRLHVVGRLGYAGTV